MFPQNLLFFTSFLLLLRSLPAEKDIESKRQSEKIQKRCPYKLRKLWQIDVSSFPFAANPLVVDVDGDGGLDVVAAPFGEALAVIEGETGKHLHDTSWPQHNLDKSLHSSPLQYDIDGDGVLDLLFITSQGEGLFYTGQGYALHKFTFQLQPVYVKSDWYTNVESVDHIKMKTVVSSSHMPGHVLVDPHVLGTPILHDMKQLIVPISFFYSDDDYDDPDGAGPWGVAGAKDKFFVGAVAVVDLQRLQKAKMQALNSDDERDDISYSEIFYLELSQKPLFNLFSPTVVAEDEEFGSKKIISGLSSGGLYTVSMDNKDSLRFNFSSLSGRVSAAELDGQPGLELILVDTSGHVTCLDLNSEKRKWSTKIGGSSFAGSQIVDVDLDGQLDVVVATDEGNVYALNGVTGAVLPKYPYKAGRRISGNVLVTKFNVIRGPYDLVFLSDDGILHILAADHSCLSQVTLAESTLVDILSQDVVLLNRGMELIVATSDGSLICLGSGSETPAEELVEEEFRVMAHRLATPSSALAHNDFTFSMEKAIILFNDNTRFLKEVTGSMLDLYFSIHGAKPGEQFDLKVYMGSQLLHQQLTDDQLRYLKVPTPEQPGQAQVTIVIYNKYGGLSSDSIFLKFNQLILLDLQWLVLAPFIAMVIILLVNHGFPAKDLLPVTFPFKAK